MLIPLLLLVPLLQSEAEPPERDWGRGLVRRAPGALEGYTLFAPLRSTTTYLVDMDGLVVHEWPSGHRPGNSAYLLEDGSLLRAGKLPSGTFRGGGEGGRVQRITWEGEVVWDLPFSNERYMQHHDIEPLPNGNVLVLAWESRTAEQALAAGRDPAQLGDSFWPDWLVEVRPVPPDGFETVWEWHAWDHLIQDFDEDAAAFEDVTAHPERIDVNGDHREQPPLSAAERAQLAQMEGEMAGLGYLGDDEGEEAAADDRGLGREERRLPGDWLHSNSVAYLAEHDLIVLSVRRFDELWVIDHSTTTAEAAGSRGGRFGRGGDLLYRWGHPRRYGRGDDGDRQLFGQHDARWVVGADGALSLTAFDNGIGRAEPPWSRVIEIRLPFDPEAGFALEPGQAYGPTRPSWSFGSADGERFYASFISGAERLSNGNTLVTEGPRGRIFEVTPDGRTVWEYENPFGMEEEEGEGRPAAQGGTAEPERRPIGPPGNMRPGGLFRATRVLAQHPGLSRL